MKRPAWILSVIIAVACWFALAISTASAADRQIAHHQGLTASIDSSFGCARQASITVRAPSEAAYSGDRLALQRLLATVRAGLSVECPMLSEIDVMGLAAGTPAFAATIGAANGWKLPSSVDRGLAGRTPTSPLAAETSTCDYDPNQPLIGCWVILSPEHLRGMIANHRRSGSWYTDTPQNLAAGTVSAQGAGIRTDYLVGVGPRVEFIYTNGARSSWIGPYFAEECALMRLDPYYLLDNMMALGPLFGVPTSAASREPIYMVRLRSPLRITADILMEESTGPGGLTGHPGDAEMVTGIPDDGRAPTFNNCVNTSRSEVSGNVLFATIVAAIPLARMRPLLPRNILGKLTRSTSPPVLRNFGGRNIADLAATGKRLDQADKAGNLTVAGRALAKHGGRPSSIFTPPKGNASAINAHGQKTLEDILEDISAIERPSGGGRFPGGFDVIDSIGRGARFNAKGEFVGFLEP